MKVYAQNLASISANMGTLTAGEILSLGADMPNRLIPAGVDISESTWPETISDNTLSAH
jgi:hypothetical protein